MTSSPSFSSASVQPPSVPPCRICIQPTIALSGVRISCDSVARNMSLARLASSASAFARLWSVMSVLVPNQRTILPDSSRMADSAREEPAVLAVLAAQRKRVFPRLAGARANAASSRPRDRRDRDDGTFFQPQPCISSNVVPV